MQLFALERLLGNDCYALVIFVQTLAYNITSQAQFKYVFVLMCACISARHKFIIFTCIITVSDARCTSLQHDSSTTATSY